LFPAGDNSNAILTVNRHGGHYDSQLGFSSDGNMYYRAFTYGTASNTTQGWHTMIHSGNVSSYAPTISFSYASGTLTITTP
jgi:hypothetical protein